MRVLAFAVLVLLAGCSQASDKPDDGGGATATGGKDQLSGFVADREVRPIVGASVSIPSVGAEATTDDTGRYAFNGLPDDMTMTVITQADGYIPSSRSLQLASGTATHVNFTLAPIPVKEPSMDVDSFNGVINCNGVVKANGDRHAVPCGMATQGAAIDARVWEFEVKPDLAGLVVEVAWEAGTELARHLNLTIETAGYGDADKVIFSTEGGTILRGQIGTFDAVRYYTQGGDVRVTVDIGRNTADEEVDLGAGVAFQQGFEVFASKFYVAPPAPSYSIADSG